MLVIGTYRDTSAEITEPLASCLADLRRLDDACRLRLEGLDEANVERFLVEATGHPLDDDLHRIAATSPGAAPATPSTSASCGATSSPPGR